MSDLLARGWAMAEATLASAGSERALVTHWFVTGEDDGVNTDDHFGSDERTLRFLGVALPTLIDQLRASVAVVAVPWNVDGAAPSLSVVAVAAGAEAAVETRALTRLSAAEPGPPFWRLEPGRVTPPPQLAAIASGLVLRT